MRLFDYTDKNITFDEFAKLINNARKSDRNEWYGFGGYVDGKRVVVKGVGTWLQQYIINGINKPSGMGISVTQFNECLRYPFFNA
jgi:hypothetical protein